MCSLADVVDIKADEFRSSAAAHVSYQLTWSRVLRAANEYPWSSARGDIEDIAMLAFDAGQSS